MRVPIRISFPSGVVVRPSAVPAAARAAGCLLRLRRWRRTVLVHEVEHVLSVADRQSGPFGGGAFQLPFDIGLVSHGGSQSWR